MKKIYFFILLIISGLAIVFPFLLKKQPSQNATKQISLPASTILASFNVNAEKAPVIEIRKNTSSLRFENELKNAVLTEENNSRTYSDKEKTIEYRYRAIEKGLKEEIILLKPAQTNEFKIKMVLENLIVGKTIDGSLAFFDQKGQYQFHFDKFFAIDKNNDKTTKIEYDFHRGQIINEYVFTLIVDEKWLFSKERVYPVIIDPTVLDDKGNVIPEIIEKRNENSKTFDAGGGKFTGHFYGNPIHYQNNSGTWLEIDTTIVPSDDADYDYMNISNTYKSYFSTDAYGLNNNIKFQKGDAWLTQKTLTDLKILETDKDGIESVKENLTLADLQPKSKAEENVKAGKISETSVNKLEYPQIFNKNTEQIDVSYEISGSRLSEKFVLNKYQGFPEFYQEITLNNVYTKIESGLINFYNKGTNEKLWFIPEPIMFEQNNQLISNRGVELKLVCKDSKTEIEKCDNIMVTKSITKEGQVWLSDPERQYPVVIDPDFAGDTTDSMIYGKDASYSTSRSTSFNHISDFTYLNTGQWLSASEYYINRSFTKFHTESIPDNNIITQVNLKMTVFMDSSSGVSFDMQIIKLDWSGQDPISSGNRETAYDNCLNGNQDDNIWHNSSGLSVNTAYTSPNLSTSWVSKTQSTYYCLISSRDKNSSTPSAEEDIFVYSQEDATASYRPVLIVDYVPPPTTKFSGVKMEGVKINKSQ